MNVSARQPAVVNSFNLGSRTVYLGGQNYNPSYRNYGWYNGYWNPNGGYGNRGSGYGYGTGGYGRGYGSGYGLLGGFAGYPLGWGLGGWGLGRTYYTSGYLPYNNPYFVQGTTTIYDYSQPVPVVTEGSNGAADEAMEDFEAARLQFRNGDYDNSLALVNRALSAQPSDAVLHEFRALVLFAQRDYEPAAATLHSVLAVGPGWDWPTMVRLYPSVETYTDQLRALESHVKGNPERAAPRFVLAYQYITAGHQDAAVKQLREVTRLMPDDRTAADLLRMMETGDRSSSPAAESSPPAEGSPSRGATPADVVESSPPIVPALMAGTWRATRDDGSKFDLTLAPDKQFVWTYSRDEHRDELSGTYVTEGSLLILQPKEAGTMIGQVKMDGKDGFNFRLMSAPPEDKGLAFTR